jgi:acetylglutamate kinase
VVAPLAQGPLNVNADEAAAALAVGLDAERILFLTDVPGVLHGGVLVPVVDPQEASRLLDAGALHGGIVPKLRAAITAARLGVRAEIGETAVVA